MLWRELDYYHFHSIVTLGCEMEVIYKFSNAYVIEKHYILQVKH